MAALVNLIAKYASAPGGPKPFDFGRKAQYFTLDVISDIAYSEPFGCLATDSDAFGYIAAVEENMPAIMFVSAIPRLNWILKSSIVRMFMPSDKDQLGFGRVMGCVASSPVPLLTPSLPSCRRRARCKRYVLLNPVAEPNSY